jgi:hypothetical protein
MADGLEQAVTRFGWEVLSFVLMPNHFHLFLRTPRPNLSRSINTSYPAMPTGTPNASTGQDILALPPSGVGHTARVGAGVRRRSSRQCVQSRPSRRPRVVNVEVASKGRREAQGPTDENRWPGLTPRSPPAGNLAQGGAGAPGSDGGMVLGGDIGLGLGTYRAESASSCAILSGATIAIPLPSRAGSLLRSAVHPDL